MCVFVGVSICICCLHVLYLFENINEKNTPFLRPAISTVSKG